MGGNRGGRWLTSSGGRGRSHHRIGPVTSLPTEGRRGPTPTWPLSLHADRDGRRMEARLWKELWHSPHAALWERFKIPSYAVAMYVRVQVEASRTGRPSYLQEARQRENDLGLSMFSMMRLRIVIDDGSAEDIGQRVPNVVDIRASQSDRFLTGQSIHINSSSLRCASYQSIQACRGSPGRHTSASTLYGMNR